MIKAHIMDCAKVGAGFDTLRDGPRTVAIREIDDPTTYDLLQSVIRTAGDELSVNL